MIITILNGNPNTENTNFDNYLHELSGILESAGHRVTTFPLKEMNINHCKGCFNCWLKTPGECPMKDDSRDILRAYCIDSDFVLFASPIIMGFTSALLKKAQERLLPMYFPYFELIDNEVRHKVRDVTQPLFGLLLEKGKNTDDEDIRITVNIYKKDALNLRTPLCFTKFITDPVKEVADEINCI